MPRRLSNEERLSWADFKKRMDLIAFFYLETGVMKGDRIAVPAAARNEFPLIYMAAGKVGVIWLRRWRSVPP